MQGVDLTDTDVAEGSFSSGDVGSQLWLGESGKITKTLPTADTKHSVFVGYLDSYQGAGSKCFFFYFYTSTEVSKFSSLNNWINN